MVIQRECGIADENLEQDIEIWKLISEFPGYDASNLGRIRSWWKRGTRKSWFIDFEGPPNILKLCLNRFGYHMVCIRDRSSRIINAKVHHLVLFAFVGPKPENHECRHLDNNRINNKISNICWGTRSENKRDRDRQVTTSNNQYFPHTKLNRQQIDEIRDLVSKGKSKTDVAKKYGVWDTTICNICNGKSWVWLTSPNGEHKRIKGKYDTKKILTETKVKEIKGLIKNGTHFKKISEQYGVSITTIYDINHGKSWSHVNTD